MGDISKEAANTLWPASILIGTQEGESMTLVAYNSALLSK
jgi:hypothetical protein